MSNPRSIVSLLSLAIVMALAFSACSPKRQTVAPATVPGTETVDPYEALVESCSPGWRQLRVPFTLRLISPKEVSIGGTATMDRDRLVILSLRMLGFEVGALQVTGDTLTVIEKMNRQYLTAPIAKALGGFDANVANIQDLLCGRVFILGADSITADMRRDFDITPDRDNARRLILTPRRQPRGARYAFAINTRSRLEDLTVIPGKHPEATVTYSGHADTPCGTMASSMTIVAEVNGKPVEALIEWDWRRARFDADVEIRPVTIGRGYKPLDIQSLLKKLPAKQ